MIMCKFEIKLKKIVAIVLKMDYTLYISNGQLSKIKKIIKKILDLVCGV